MIEFIFPYRLHRLAYFIRGMVADAVTYFLYSCSTTMDSTVWWGSIIALWIYGIIFITLPRVRDLGMSGWWLLVTFVPVADFVFGIILLLRAPVILSRRPEIDLPRDFAWQQ
jgi:uncharacterized membrane protein YhaH (DUF805 family)